MIGQHEFAALGTTATVLTTDPAAVDRAAEVTRQVTDDLDAACSRFRPDSELMCLRCGVDQRVSPTLAAVLDAAMTAAESTHGLVDPTVGSALIGLGYDRDFAELDGGEVDAPSSATAAGNWRRVRFDRARRVVRIPAGVVIDVGATGKAFAADLAAQRAATATKCGVLVNLGGDIATAGGSPAGGWPVGIADSHRAAGAQVQQTISLSTGALATSSVTARVWRRNGRQMHHIVDPATGEPADVVWRTVSVTAPSCVAANTASTACLVDGHRAVTLLTGWQLPARLATPAGHVLTIGGWPQQAVAA